MEKLSFVNRAINRIRFGLDFYESPITCGNIQGKISWTSTSSAAYTYKMVKLAGSNTFFMQFSCS
uniref:Uncharacterized protein n=1 Tax=Meloidogyne enterolobii TaxID=390850 RepID=A0A6V7UF48_MELEN|nr:unnamed protein product [Meloidogyne enterolobii]